MRYLPLQFAVSDVLMMTSGALCWMPDLRRYFGLRHGSWALAASLGNL